VGSADSDVVQSAVVAEGEFAVGVDDVAPNAGLRRPRERCGRQLL
jgi:hypothetical protein